MTDTSKRLRFSLLLVLLTLLGGLIARPAQAQTGQRCFPETGQCISGPIRTYWERNGGLPIFGYPISPQRVETVEGRQLSVQWFERDRLEDHGAQSVLAGRLGARMLELTTRPWEYFDKLSLSQKPEGCLFAEPTGHTLCEPFRSYWERNGGLMRFGYPITQPFRETIEGQSYTVQYFERRRMELHPELPGGPVLLGLLGREVLNTPEPPISYPACLDQTLASLRPFLDAVRHQGQPVGCPILHPWENLPAATQQFERGEMLWLGERDLRPPMSLITPVIFALSQPGPRFSVHDDTWRAGDPDMPSASPPREGLYAPWRGFGSAWIASPELRDRLGWAIEPQAQARTADVQMFHGLQVVRIRETGRIYSFGSPLEPSQVRVIQP